MNNLSDIAKVYLADIEVLTEAQKALESELHAWWQEIVVSGVMPDLAQDCGRPLISWLNVEQPGQAHLRHTTGQTLLLQILDPRLTQRPFYTVYLLASSRPSLKKVSADTELKKRLEQLALDHRVGDKSGLNWNSTNLAEHDVALTPDDPEATGKQLRDVARRFFRLVIEQGKG